MRGYYLINRLVINLPLLMMVSEYTPGAKCDTFNRLLVLIAVNTFLPITSYTCITATVRLSFETNRTSLSTGFGDSCNPLCPVTCTSDDLANGGVISFM